MRGAHPAAASNTRNADPATTAWTTDVAFVWWVTSVIPLSQKGVAQPYFVRHGYRRRSVVPCRPYYQRPHMTDSVRFVALKDARGSSRRIAFIGAVSAGIVAVRLARGAGARRLTACPSEPSTANAVPLSRVPVAHIASGKNPFSLRESLRWSPPRRDGHPKQPGRHLGPIAASCQTALSASWNRSDSPRWRSDR
jgi:hypothetical protein